VVKALTSYRTDQTLHVDVLPGDRGAVG